MQSEETRVRGANKASECSLSYICLRARENSEPQRPPSRDTYYSRDTIGSGGRSRTFKLLDQNQATLPICLPPNMAASPGFEPRLLAPEASVLPLDDKAIKNTAIAAFDLLRF